MPLLTALQRDASGFCQFLLKYQHEKLLSWNDFMRCARAGLDQRANHRNQALFIACLGSCRPPEYWRELRLHDVRTTTLLSERVFPEFQTALNAYFDLYFKDESPGAYVFGITNPYMGLWRPLTQGSLRALLRDIRKQSAVERFGTRMLRSTSALYCAFLGMTSNEISQRLGHRTPLYVARIQRAWKTISWRAKLINDNLACVRKHCS